MASGITEQNEIQAAHIMSEAIKEEDGKFDDKITHQLDKCCTMFERALVPGSGPRSLLNSWTAISHIGEIYSICARRYSGTDDERISDGLSTSRWKAESVSKVLKRVVQHPIVLKVHKPTIIRTFAQSPIDYLEQLAPALLKNSEPRDIYGYLEDYIKLRESNRALDKHIPVFLRHGVKHVEATDVKFTLANLTEIIFLSQTNNLGPGGPLRHYCYMLINKGADDASFKKDLSSEHAGTFIELIGRMGYDLAIPLICVLGQSKHIYNNLAWMTRFLYKLHRMEPVWVNDEFFAVLHDKILRSTIDKTIVSSRLESNFMGDTKDFINILHVMDLKQTLETFIDRLAYKWGRFFPVGDLREVLGNDMMVRFDQKLQEAKDQVEEFGAESMGVG